MIEKPESIALEGLCAVRSAKAHRLSRIKKGFYNPPTGKPTFVPGQNWLMVMVLGMTGTPTLAAMRFWTRRREWATDRQSVTLALLTQLAQAWGQGSFTFLTAAMLRVRGWVIALRHKVVKE